MPRFTNKETGVTVEIGDEDTLPGSESDWEAEGSGHKKASRRRADTGSVPVQDNGR